MNQTLLDSVSTESLPFLEEMLNELFNPSTNDLRKREIEEILNNFSSQDNSWLYAIRFLVDTKSDYTKIFCFDLLENLFLKKWYLNDALNKDEIRKWLWNYTLESNETKKPFYILNKLVKLLAVLVKLDYPDTYPNYFKDIYKLLFNENTAQLGLKILTITIEEISSSRNNLFTSRKIELNEILLMQSSKILAFISNLVHDIISKYKINELLVLTDLKFFFKTWSHMQTFMTVDDKVLLIKVFDCLSSFISWLPNNDIIYQIDSEVINCIIVFSLFNICGDKNINLEKSINLGYSAINVLNEILYKKFAFNSETFSFYSKIFVPSFKFLELITKDIINFNYFDNDYGNKVMDFLQIFVISYINTYQYDNNDSLTKLFELIFKMTFKVEMNDYYFNLIEIWKTLLDHFINKIENCSNNVEQFLCKELGSQYKEAFSTIIGKLLYKIQYRYSLNILKNIDDVDLDEDGFTDLQKHFSQNINLILKITFIVPEESFNMLYMCFEETVKICFEINNFKNEISLKNNVSVFDNLDKTNLEIINCHLKDLNIILEILSKISSNYVGNSFETAFKAIKNLLEKLLLTLNLLNQFKIVTCGNEQIGKNINKVHSSLFTVLNSYCVWILQYFNASLQKEQDHFECLELIKKICNECVKPILTTIEGLDLKENNITAIKVNLPNETIFNSLLCLRSISFTIKPRVLIELISIQILFERTLNSINVDIDCSCNLNKKNNAQYLNGKCVNCTFNKTLITYPNEKCTYFRIEKESEYVLVDVLNNFLILPWRNVTDNLQQWENRSLNHKNLLTKFYDYILIEFNGRLNRCTDFIKYPGMIKALKRTLNLLSNLIENNKESPSRTKHLLLNSISTFVEFIIIILPQNIFNQDLGEPSLNFIVKILDVLRLQIKIPILEEILRILLEIESKNEVNYLSIEENYRNLLIEKLFKIFIYIVEQPKTNFKNFLPQMLNLCLTKFEMIVEQSNCCELNSLFYDFLFKFLLNNPKYFFKSKLLISLKEDHLNNEETFNKEQFVYIMELFGKSFYKQDLNIFKQNLLALETLNYRQKLFYKDLFREHLLKKFIMLFLEILFNNTHQLLQDEIINILYSLATVDFKCFKMFCNNLLTNELQKLSAMPNIELNVDKFLIIKKDEIEDIPSFNQNLTLFVNDLRLFKNFYKPHQIKF